MSTSAWRHSEKTLSYHYNLSISLETAAHQLNKFAFHHIVYFMIHRILPIFFPPEGLFTARFSWISVKKKKTGTNILPAFFLFPISLLPKGKSWLFLCTCRILHISGVWHRKNFFLLPTKMCPVCLFWTILNFIGNRARMILHFCASTGDTADAKDCWFSAMWVALKTFCLWKSWKQSRTSKQNHTPGFLAFPHMHFSTWGIDLMGG